MSETEGGEREAEQRQRVRKSVREEREGGREVDTTRERGDE